MKRLKGRKALTNYIDESINADSDCEGEGDSTGTDGGELKNEENERTCAILAAGSFSAYVRLPATPSFQWLKRLSPAGNLFFSITAQTLYLSLPSNLKAPTLA